MRPFRRRLGRYFASFTAEEASLVSDLVDQVRQLLAGRRAQAPDDPLVAMTGMVVGSSRPPEDPAVARLLPDFSTDDAELSSALRVLREPELIALKDGAAVALLDSLPRGGGTVRLDEDAAQSWIGALNDVRLALGVRMDLTDDGPPPGADDPQSPEAAMYATYRWLSAVQDSLVTAMAQ
ncbi:DUF2017 domain-containing protein [Nakamurella flavida]|uniref:DUF2017 domain-containing protein n=1 Tax=Nakamurella flavida TaxID=363630 RepID=A0A939C0Z3_9ACTN|nr:DUF2017 domain-containing protein [Nakamurella flavida]MBM9477208.1 DUF2017 domain-containing protein [Nakamurella flavida]MDP9780157.1 hypothetical protein [Nakamurella flavida]